jgi:presenilin-like A22 family membrane protease
MVNLRHLIPILGILIGVQIGATFLSVPTQANDVTAFGDPQSLDNPFIYLGSVVVITLVILGLYKLGFRKFLTVFFMLSVWATMFFVTSTIVLQYYGDTNVLADLVALVLPVLATILIWKFPEWYVIDTIGFIMCIGVTAILGVSFGIIPVIVLLAIFAIYDAISVYKTRHMITLAESILTQKLPALFIIPKDRNFSYRDPQTWDNLDDTSARKSYIIGMGDIIFPSSMVVSASVFLTGTKVFGVFTLPAIGAMIGSWIGLVALQWYATKNPRSHAGLPFLNTFTIIGFAVAYAATLAMG